MEQNAIQAKVSQRLLVIALLTLFTVVMWAGVKIVESFSKEKKTVEYEKYTKKYPTRFDEEVFEEIEKRESEYQIFNEEYLGKYSKQPEFVKPDVSTQDDDEEIEKEETEDEQTDKESDTDEETTSN